MTTPTSVPPKLESAANWYPDPTRRHQLRWFDGHEWTDNAADAGITVQDALGPLPPGRLHWPNPVDMVPARPVVVDGVPRLKMWVLAVLSLFVFSFQFGEKPIAFPFGLGFAAWCWVATAEPLRGLRRAQRTGTREIWIARSLAALLACMSIMNTVPITR